ncbi:hypothetical protein PENSPDRAFT_687106 [Peniophora sp. CONT]|nr:hypothetical protein PENSPDRAFT_687106 [Peniophora sp. CONT]
MFLRPSSAHYTYRPAAYPVRDRRAYKDLPASLYNGIEPDFDFGLTHEFTDNDSGLRAPDHPTNLSAEARYRRALEEAYAAKEELRVQSEEARLRDEAIALQSEVARLRAERAREEARLNEIRLEEARLTQAMRQEARMIQAAKERERRAAEEAREEARRRELVARRRAALLQQERARHAVRQLFDAPAAPQVARAQSRPQPQPQARPITLADLLERSLAPPEAPKSRPQPAKPEPAVQAPVPTPISKAQSKAEASPEQVNMKEVYDFFYNLIGVHTPHNERQPSTSTTASASVSRSQDKGKAKAAPEPAPAQAPVHDFLEQRLEERLARETEQEMADTARAILNSLRDQHAAPSATSSKVHTNAPPSSERASDDTLKVTVENAPLSSSTSSADLKRVPELSGNAAQNIKTQFAAHRRSTSQPASPTTPLERIQSIRSSLISLRASFHFPATPDYNTTGDLSYSATNTPLRAYEHALNDLLEKLDGIESEGDEAVRGHRREVVKEVELALGEFDERVRAASPVRPSTPQPEVEVEVKQVEVKEEVEVENVEATEKAEVGKEAEAKEAEMIESKAPAGFAVSVAAPIDSLLVELATETGNAVNLAADVEPSSDVAPSVDIESVVDDAHASTDISIDVAATPIEDPVHAYHDESLLAQEQTESIQEEPVAVQGPAISVSTEPATAELPAVSDDVINAYVVETAPAEPLPSGAAVEANATPPALDVPPSVLDASVPSDETVPSPSSPQPGQSPSESFLTSLSHDHFSIPPTPQHKDVDADELEDSVLIENEDDRDSERSWSEVE